MIPILFFVFIATGGFSHYIFIIPFLRVPFQGLFANRLKSVAEFIIKVLTLLMFACMILVNKCNDLHCSVKNQIVYRGIDSADILSRTGRKARRHTVWPYPFEKRVTSQGYTSL
jgi:hypothetical protein